MSRLVWIAVGLTVTAGALWIAPIDLAQAFIREGGPEEWATAALYGVVLLVALFGLGWRTVWRHWPLALVPLVFMMRELDFDKRFTSAGIFTSRFYLRAGAGGLGERLVGLSVIALLLLWVGVLVSRYGRYFWTSLRQRTPKAVLALIVAALALAAYAIDGFGRKVRKIGVEIGAAVELHARVIEETMELGIPLVMLAWICEARGAPRRRITQGPIA